MRRFFGLKFSCISPLLGLLLLASGPRSTSAQGDTYFDSKQSCRPAGVLPSRTPPLPSCDPIKHDAIVTKQAYDQSERHYNYWEDQVNKAEDRVDQVNNDGESSRQVRDRAREVLLQKRAELQRVKEIGEANAQAYKDAEEAMKQDRGYYLDKNSFDKASNALEYLTLEQRYNQGIAEAAKSNDNRNKKYGSGVRRIGAPAIGGGSFVGGGNTDASRKNRNFTIEKRTNRYKTDNYEGGERRTGNETNWQDGGGDWRELGEDENRKRLATGQKSFRQGGSGFRVARNNAFGGRKFKEAGAGSLGFVRDGAGAAGPAPPQRPVREGAIGGPAMQYLREAEALFSQKDYRGAANSAKYVGQVDPNNAQAFLIEAKSYNALGRYAEAEAAARKVLALDPNNAAAYQELAWALLHQGKYESAMRMASLAIRLKPNNAKAYLIRALTYEMLGQRGLMMADLEKAAKLDHKFRPHLQHAKDGGQLFDPSAKNTLSLLTETPAFPMLEGKDPVKMSLFFISALALGFFAIWQVRRRRNFQQV